MKKLCALFIVLCVLIGCVGCAVNEMGINQDSISNNSSIDTTSTKEDHDVPLILYFDSFESIGELKSMLAKDDGTVNEYLKTNQYHMNGLKTKEDIDKLFKDIGDLKMLHLDSASGYTLAGISYYVSYNYIMSTYRNETDIVRFICYIDDPDVVDSKSETDEFKTDVIGNISIGNNTFELHCVDDESSLFALASSVETDNSQITILFSEDNKDVIQGIIGENIIFEPLLNFVSK